jgi:hypothetical protein
MPIEITIKDIKNDIQRHNEKFINPHFHIYGPIFLKSRSYLKKKWVDFYQSGAITYLMENKSRDLGSVDISQ